MYRYSILAACCALALAACGSYKTAGNAAQAETTPETNTTATAGETASEDESGAPNDLWEMDMSEKVELSEEEWRKRLTEEQFHILREKGTERAGTGEYAYSRKDGVYHCAGCGLPLFSSDTKYESGTGWPSFWEPIKDGHVAEEEDNSLFMKRTEVLCSRCGGHLGHVFPDGPQPTGLRYCINSASLELVEEKEGEAKE